VVGSSEGGGGSGAFGGGLGSDRGWDFRGRKDLRRKQNNNVVVKENREKNPPGVQRKGELEKKRE